ncbi:HAD hydrolase-like protein [Planctomycetota bacterium]|jgi:histidinol phosphatase-like enzyme|nr:HAD hydrolase-like protein [Planctomycetota bacterium]
MPALHSLSGQSPLGGWGPPPRGLFLDVLGTLVEPGPGGRFKSIGNSSFYEGVLDSLFHATQAGWHLYLIGNVETVAFGKQSQAQWDRFRDGLVTRLKSEGIPVRRDYTCTNHPEGVKGQDRDSVYLLPGTGAMHHAAQAEGISLSLSWVVGDGTADLVAGWRAGCCTAGVRTGNGLKDGAFHVDPDMTAESAAGAIKWIARDQTVLRRSA